MELMFLIKSGTYPAPKGSTLLGIRIFNLYLMASFQSFVETLARKFALTKAERKQIKVDKTEPAPVYRLFRTFINDSRGKMSKVCSYFE